MGRRPSTAFGDSVSLTFRVFVRPIVLSFSSGFLISVGFISFDELIFANEALGEWTREMLLLIGLSTLRGFDRFMLLLTLF